MYGGPPGAGGPGTDPPNVDIATSWAMLLEPLGGSTRLVSRTRYRHGPGFRNALAGGPALLEPISAVMTKKMLRVIKGLVEEGRR